MKKASLFLLVFILHAWALFAQNWSYHTQSNAPLNATKGIFVDHQNRLWAARTFIISVLENGTWTNYPISGFSAVGNYTIPITEDLDGNIWFGCSSGAVRFDGTHFTKYSTQNGLAGYRVMDIKVDSENRIWFATSGGVSVLQDSTWTSYTPGNSGIISSNTQNIYIDSENSKWIGTNQGVCKFDGENWINYGNTGSPFNDHVLSSIQDNQGTMWFGTTKGISSFNGIFWNHLTLNQSVNAITKDHNNTLWFATSTNGVLQYNGTDGFYMDTTNSGLMDNRVNSFAWDKNCGLLFGHHASISILDYCLDVTEHNASSVNIYPNPTSEGFTINLTGNKPSNLQIFSTTGQCVYHEQKIGTDAYVDVSHLPAGIYVLKLHADGQDFTSKIIKQ